MECKVCGKPIIGKRPDSKYCSVSCVNTAKQMRATERYLNELNGFEPDNEINTKKPQQMPQNASEELRSIEKENFNTILNLRSEYGDKIRALENTNLKQEFTIEKLKDQVIDLKEKHSKELTEANTSTTKETVTAITQMPAIQSALGAFANNLIPSSANGLGNLADQLNIQERQIIDAIRRMQPDAQTYLAQMLYVLFSKPHQEQMQIFSTLQAYMVQEEQEEEAI